MNVEDSCKESNEKLRRIRRTYDHMSFGFTASINFSWTLICQTGRHSRRPIKWNLRDAKLMSVSFKHQSNRKISVRFFSYNATLLFSLRDVFSPCYKPQCPDNWIFLVLVIHWPSVAHNGSSKNSLSGIIIIYSWYHSEVALNETAADFKMYIANE